MTDTEILAYVQAVASAQGIALTEHRATSVASHMALAQRLATLLDGAELAPHDELVQIYCPAPFPDAPADETTP